MGIPIDSILQNANLAEIYIAELLRCGAFARCLIVPCLDQLEEVEDFLAVELGSGAATTHLGVAAILGLDQLVRPQNPGRVAVHATPLDWLRSGAEGCCVLDWVKAAPILQSQPVGFLVSSRGVARMLRDSGVPTASIIKANIQRQVRAA